MSIMDAMELHRGDSVEYYGRKCTVFSIDKRCGLLGIKASGEKGFITYT